MSKHELSDANIPVLVRFGIGLFLLMVVAMIAMGLLFNYLAAQPEPPGTVSPMAERELPPAPRLQVAPSVDLEQMRAREDEALTTYGWVDREAGTVRIPIERAMDLLAERGLP